MLVHAFTKTSQPAKWFQISGSLLHQLRFQGEAEIVLDSCSQMPIFLCCAKRLQTLLTRVFLDAYR